MGKQGPCCHCGIATTPLWRNGPADKPVLCNACGSRWRTKGTLVNYMPMHSGGLGLKSSTLKKSTPKMTENLSLKRRGEFTDGLLESYRSYQRADHSRGVLHEDDACTRSSTGSGMSVSESCVQRSGTGRASDCWPPWGCNVPSKRRSVMHRHCPSANRLSYCFPKSDFLVFKPPCEEDLLVDYKSPSTLVEIGLGGVLIRPPASGAPAQESQASSLMCEKQEIKQSITLESDVTKVSLMSAPFSEGSSKHKGKDKMRHFPRSSRTGGNGATKSWIPNKTLLDNFPYNKRDVLQSCHSPLVFVELKDIINSDTFMGLLTEQEKHQLMKHLSPVDKADSLKSMFSSAQFESALRGFQDLLSGGMFDSLESGVSPRVLQHYQQLLTISNLTRSGWIERCSQMRKRKSSGEYAKIMQGKEYLKEKLKGLSNLGADGLCSSIDLVRGKHLPAGNRGSIITEVDETPDPSLDPSTTFCQTTPISHITSDRERQPAELSSRQKKNSSKPCGFDGESNSKFVFTSQTHHFLHQGRKFSMEAPTSGLLEHAVLLDLPSNLSFQQAELLHQPVCCKSPPKDAGNLASQSSKIGNEPIQDNIWPSEPNLDWSEFLWNSPSAGSVNDTF